ncbi:MAG TPA: glycosyltransferase family 2 protein [Solirubrobacterales bacterium]|nr:glycosyltransferase family 2 protein [Solirubrobacterales bacterium]
MSEGAGVAIVIPSWNSAELLPRCLDSVARQGEVELVVVDNGSADGSVELLRKRGIDPLTLPENVGFAAAVDLGVARTKAPLVMPLNADTELEPGALDALAAALEVDPGLGGAAPRILQVEGEAREVGAARLYSAGQGLTPDGRAVELGAGEAQGAWLRRREVFGVCGAACLLRRELFDELGGYERSFFAFYEDVDLNVRAQIAGWRFEYVPEAVVWHLGNVSWQAEAPRPGAWNARLVARNRIVTQARFMPATALPRIVTVEVGALIRAARQGRFVATLGGKLEGLRLLPRALRERRHLAATGDLSRPRAWLGK